MKTIVIFFFFLIASIFGFSQNKTIEGRVFSFGNIGLQNVKVEAVKSKKEVLTDSNGQFKIECNPSDVIKIDANQFRSKKVKIKSGDNEVLQIELSFNYIDFDLDKAFNDAYVPDSEIENVKAYIEKLTPDYCSFSDIFTLIEECCPSVSLNSDGSETEVFLRGNTSCVLYVLNGMQVFSISHLAPCDIKSVKVVKDAMATSRYGSNGANGVLMIKTK